MKVPPCQQSVPVVAAVWVYSISLPAAELTSSVVQQTSGLCYQLLAWGFWQGAASYTVLW